MLYVMRHGKTDWNAQYRLQGGTDVPLNDEGRRMAREAAKKYKDVHFDVCFVSPLQRARETADIFLEGRGIPIIVDNRLREMGFGPAEGVDHVYEKPDCPAYKMFKDPEHYVAKDGAESFEELFARTGEFLKEKAEPLVKEGKSVLIIGHGAMNTSIINRYRNVPLKNFWETLCGNCELVQIL